MQVATVDAEGRPSLRTVLAKAIDERGVTFYTNYRLGKGPRSGRRSPYAAAQFLWLAHERQVRLTGPVAGVGGRDRGLLPQPAARLAARRVGLAAVAGDRLAGRARGRPMRGRSAVRRRRDRRPAALGRVPDRARGGRVLAGPTRTACMIGCASAGRVRTGCSRGWRRERACGADDGAARERIVRSGRAGRRRDPPRAARPSGTRLRRETHDAAHRRHRCSRSGCRRRCCRPGRGGLRLGQRGAADRAARRHRRAADRRPEARPVPLDGRGVLPRLRP